MKIPKGRMRFLLFGFFVYLPLVLIAAKVCHNCDYFQTEEVCTTTCDAGHKWEMTPAYHACYGALSSLECFEQPEITVVVTDYYDSGLADPTATGSCSDCDWEWSFQTTTEPHECWQDDTGCGGNG
jgi:hypothetical protein